MNYSWWSHRLYTSYNKSKGCAECVAWPSDTSGRWYWIFHHPIFFFRKIKIEKQLFGCPNALVRRPNCSRSGFITFLTLAKKHTRHEWVCVSLISLSEMYQKIKKISGTFLIVRFSQAGVHAWCSCASHSSGVGQNNSLSWYRRVSTVATSNGDSRFSFSLKKQIDWFKSKNLFPEASYDHTTHSAWSLHLV